MFNRSTKTQLLVLAALLCLPSSGLAQNWQFRRNVGSGGGTSAFVFPRAIANDELDSNIVSNQGPTLSNATDGRMASDAGTFASSIMIATGLALPAEDTATFVAESNSATTAMNVASAVAGGTAQANPGESIDFGFEATSTENLILEGQSTDGLLYGTLYLAENEGIVVSGNATANWGHRIRAEIAPFWAQASRNFFTGQWTLAASLPGDVNINMPVGSVNHHFTFAIPVTNGEGITLLTRSDGIAPARAAGEGIAEVSAFGSALAWVYAVPTDTMPIPGDFNGDGQVNNQDYQIWVLSAPIGSNTPIAIGASGPQGNADLDGDIDFDDLQIWLSNQNTEQLPGDYNQDDVVDAADYVIWRKTFGSTSNLQADADLSGVVDQADYDIWRGLFGTSLAGSAASMVPNEAVPEPSATTLVVLALLTVFLRGPNRSVPKR